MRRQFESGRGHSLFSQVSGCFRSWQCLVKQHLIGSGPHRDHTRSAHGVWAPSDAEGDKILFIFDCGNMTEDTARRIVLPADELSTSAFHDPDVLDELMIDRLARRVSAAVQARRPGRTAYLEHGH